jgi:hypothetical protein
MKAYLKDLGIRYFSAREVSGVPADRVTVVERAGFLQLLPPPKMWWWTGAVFAMAERVREMAQSPVRARWHWRPEAVNSVVGGSPRSDHLYGKAVDLWFESPRRRDQALAWLVPLLLSDLQQEVVGLSLGLGRTMLHLGVGVRARHWIYGKKRTPTGMHSSRDCPVCKLGRTLGMGVVP